MSSNIKFGTDGWRGIMADDFTFDNVRLVSRAIAGYVNSHNLGKRGIVVGYDNRFLSDRFADTVSEVIRENGIPVYKTKEPTPTPVTAYGVKSRNAAGAVMITASHNPPEYNGIKFIPDYAGPASPTITSEIEENLKKLKRGNGKAADDWNMETAGSLAENYADISTKMYVNRMEKERAEEKKVDLFNDYVVHMRELIDIGSLKKANLKLVVDPMYGCGIGYLEGLLRDYGSEVVEIQCRHDPLFGGHLPEPTGELLGDLKSWVTSERAHLGLALDGDADRFGIIDADGSYLTPNQFLPLVYYHLLRFRGMTGPVTRTVATTHLLDKMAKRYGQEVLETPVGFKYIGENMREKGCILGGEESGGLSIKGHIPEKDGILAGILAAEIVAYHGKSLGKLLKEIHDQFGKVYSDRTDVKTDPADKKEIQEEMKRYHPSEIARTAVSYRNTTDGVKFVLQNGSWVLIRASGTEPVFRIYAEAENKERVKEIQNEVCKELGLKRNN